MSTLSATIIVIVCCAWLAVVLCLPDWRSRWRLPLCIALVLVIVVSIATSGDGPDEGYHSRCTEDMKCWNCSTMGNHRCGP